MSTRGNTWGYYAGNEFDHHAHSVHILVGFFFALNYMLGYCVLAVAYAVHYTGLAVGWLIILFISALCCCTAWWTLEVMARAQVNIFFVLIYLQIMYISYVHDIQF